MKKPKVAIILSHPIQHFCPQYKNLAKSKDYQIKVFFASSIGAKPYFDENFGKKVNWKNLDLNSFDHMFLNKGKSCKVNHSLDAPNLDSELLNYYPDIVLIYGYSQKLQRRAYQWATKNTKKVFYFSDSELRHKRPLIKKLLKYLFLRNYFKRIDSFLTIGDANESYYRFYGVPDYKMFRSAYPINIELYEKAFQNRIEHSKKLRHELIIPENNLIISVVGKLVPWKRQIDLIVALTNLQNKYNNITLLVIGSGEMEKDWKMKSNNNNNIIFTGFVGADKLPNYYACTDLYVHPAEIEPHSVAISEAIYMGCPVILSDRCGSYGPNDDVQNGRNGFVYKCGDIYDLTTKIKILLDRKELREKFSANSRKYAVEAQHLAHCTGLSSSINNVIY